MKNIYLLFFIFSLIIFNLSFIDSKFVCGFVNSSEEFSSSWIDVIVYSPENSLDTAECKVNPENKFCCDLEEITSVNLKTGKQVFAEIFEKEEGLIAGPVSLYLTEEGFDVFPEMSLEKAIKINSPNQTIFINTSFIYLNISLSDKYNNFSYSLNSTQNFSEQQICTECTEAEFSVPLAKGRNEIILTAYKNREISEKLIFYNLDYFNFKLNVFCDKCRANKGYFYVPAQNKVIFSSSFNASSEISGDFLFYFPIEWELSNFTSSKDFSLTHKSTNENIVNQKEFTINYTLQSPNTLIKRIYSFYQLFEGKEKENKIIIFKSNLIPFRQKKSFKTSYFKGNLNQRASPNEPILIDSVENSLKTIAIFPNKVVSKSYSNLEFERKNKRNENEYSFKILTTLSEKEINQILLIFKVEKGKSIEVKNNQNKLNLEFYKEDANYTYYSLSILEKGPFNVKIF